MKTLIGSNYIPVDNSYSKCLNTGEKVYLGGTKTDLPIVTRIIEEPFKQDIENVFTKSVKTHDFVLTEDENGNIYKILFDERGLDVKQMKEKHSEFMTEWYEII